MVRAADRAGTERASGVRGEGEEGRQETLCGEGKA